MQNKFVIMLHKKATVTQTQNIKAIKGQRNKPNSAVWGAQVIFLNKQSM